MGQNCTAVDHGGNQSNPNGMCNSSSTYTFDPNEVIELIGRIAEVVTSPEVRAAEILMLNCTRVFFAIGLLGNILTFLVLMRMRPLKSWTVYVVVLAVSDNLVLLLKLLVTEMALSKTVDISQGACKLFLFFGMTFSEFSHWVIVCMTVERFAVIWFPLKINGSNVRRAYCLVTILAVLLPCNNIAYFWIKGDGWNPVTYYICQPDSEYDEFVTHYWRWIRATVYGYIPLSVVLLANTFIVLGWMVSNKQHRKLTRPGRKMTITVEDVSKHVQVTAMITSVSVAFALAAIPHMVYMHVSSGINISVDGPKQTLLFMLTVALADLNYCCNFFLYSATSSEFRGKMKLLFCKSDKTVGNVRHNTNLSNISTGSCRVE